MTETVVFVALVCGLITMLIGQKKNMGLFGSFIIGALLGLIGIVIMLFLPTQLPKAPKGMYAAKCCRCSAVQNLPIRQAEFECWQCKTVQDVFKGALS